MIGTHHTIIPKVLTILYNNNIYTYNVRIRSSIIILLSPLLYHIIIITVHMVAGHAAPDFAAARKFMVV